MNHELEILGNVPVGNSVIATLYPNIKGENNKICQLEKSGDIVRLKRGLYVVSPNITGKPLSVELVANHIYPLSYVSCHTALRYYGLIPETVFTIQSMTIKHSRTFINELGRFEYIHISPESFAVGITQIKNGEYSFLIATPEKALCDLVAITHGLNLRYIDETKAFLSQDLRFDMDEFYKMRIDIFEQYALVGKKNNSIKTIIKLLKEQ